MHRSVFSRETESVIRGGEVDFFFFFAMVAPGVVWEVRVGPDGGHSPQGKPRLTGSGAQEFYMGGRLGNEKCLGAPGARGPPPRLVA